MPFFLSVAPIVLLIYLMVKRKPLTSYQALPLTALIIFIIQLFYFNTEFTLAIANVVSGFGLALTPITIVFGAILFNKILETTGAMNVIRKWLSTVTDNPVGQLMIIGWAFAFMIEGASGFGTPAAIAAPLLISLGYRAIPIAILTLAMNSVPVNFGAVGTPTWFGFSNLNFSEAQLLEIGFKSSIINFITAFMVVVVALRFVVSFKEIGKNIVFIYLSILSCTIPLIIIAKFNYEFPSLLAGAIGTVITILLAKAKIGLKKTYNQNEIKFRDDFNLEEISKSEKPSFGIVFKAISPFIILIGLLIITRIQQLGIKGLLNNATPFFNVDLKIFDFSISNALIFKFSNIFGTNAAFDYKTLYVPALIPFVVTVIITIFIFRANGKSTATVFKTSLSAIKLTYIALGGALAMVQLMKISIQDTSGISMITIIGEELSTYLGSYWVWFAAFLGSIGAFFSGSNTVSNLTFAGIQNSIAVSSGYNPTTILALQNVGGAMGNMTCLNNIIAVSTVAGIHNKEGHIIVRTAIPMFAYGIFAAVIATLGIQFFGW